MTECQREERERQMMQHRQIWRQRADAANLKSQAVEFLGKQIRREGHGVLTLQSKQLKEEWK